MVENIFNNKYKVIKIIGKGGMSTVYLAQSTTLKTYWAIKVVDKKWSSKFDLLAEPNILKNLKHTSLPRIIDIEQDSKYIYIIEDYIEGTPLDKQLKLNKRFDEIIVLNWAKQLCDVLSYLHNQSPNPIIYRDMKPSNIIIDKNNNIKLIDFGIAREYKKENNSDTTYMGTRGYAAPEQYGKSQTDERTDIYSLGATMYHLLTGISPSEPPYEFKPLRSINKNFSEGIEYIVNKCIQNNPINRYQNIGELIYDLNNIHKFNSFYIKQKKIQRIKNLIKSMFLILSISLIILGTTSMIEAQNIKYTNIIEKGYAELNLHKFDNAQKIFEEAKSLNNKRLDSYLGIAQIFLKQNNYEECLKYLDDINEKIGDLDRNPQYLYIRGNAYYELKDYEKAYSYFKKVHKIDSSNLIYNRDLAVCLAKLGELEQAQNIIDNVFESSKSDDVLNYINGEIYLKQGNIEAAIGSFNNTISETKDELLKKKSYISISDIYKSNRNTIDNSIVKQIEILNKAINDLNNKEDIAIIESLAEAYFENNDYENSAVNFEKLIEIGYDRAYIYSNLAIIYQHTGDYHKAEEILYKMKEKYKEDYTCYLRLAFLYLDIETQRPEDIRNYKKAVEYYKLAIKFAPNGANTQDIIPLTSKINELSTKGWI